MGVGCTLSALVGKLSADLVLYKRNLGEEAWTRVFEDRTIAESDIYNQAFVCVVDQAAQNKFLENYSQP